MDSAELRAVLDEFLSRTRLEERYGNLLGLVESEEEMRDPSRDEMRAALNEEIDEHVEEIRGYLEALAAYRRALGVWGAVREVGGSRKQQLLAEDDRQRQARALISLSDEVKSHLARIRFLRQVRERLQASEPAQDS